MLCPGKIKYAMVCLATNMAGYAQNMVPAQPTRCTWDFIGVYVTMEILNGTSDFCMLLSVSTRLLLLVVEDCEGKIGVEGKSSKTQRKGWKMQQGQRCKHAQTTHAQSPAHSE